MTEFGQSVRARRQGVQADVASGHARTQAMLHGIRLCGLTGNVWPANDDGLSQLVSQEIISELMAFAIQARRYMELTRNKDLSADGPLLRVNLPEFRYETSVWTAVNRIVHASQIEIFSVEPKPTKHDNLGDLLVANALVTSPQRDTIAVCPQGMFYGFAQSPMTGPAIYPR